jgi:hypothetical protein
MGAVYHVVYSGDDEPPTQTEIDAWITAYGLYNNTLIPNGSTPDEVHDAFERRECTYIVETGCMQIQWRLCTCTSGNCTTSAELGLDELSTALGGGS